MLKHIKENNDRLKNNIEKSISSEFQVQHFNAVVSILNKGLNENNISIESYKTSIDNLIIKAEENFITAIGYPSNYQFISREELKDLSRLVNIGDVVETQDGEGRVKEVRRHPFDQNYIMNVVVSFPKGEDKTFLFNDIVKKNK